jgi:hypothetical protein
MCMLERTGIYPEIVIRIPIYSYQIKTGPKEALMGPKKNLFNRDQNNLKQPKTAKNLCSMNID